MAIINSIASWLMKKRMHQIELFIKYPVDVQSEWMTSLLNSAANTEYGKQNKFSEIKSYNQFKNQIPINDYETLKPLIDRTRRSSAKLVLKSI